MLSIQWDEGTVQPTNPKGAAKVVVGCITVWPMVRSHPGPQLTTFDPYLKKFMLLALMMAHLEGNVSSWPELFPLIE
jgi:hypothetical protein